MKFHILTLRSSEFDLRSHSLLGCLHLEERFRLKAEHTGDDVAREHLDPVLVALGRVVVILPRKTDLVLRSWPTLPVRQGSSDWP